MTPWKSNFIFPLPLVALSYGNSNFSRIKSYRGQATKIAIHDSRMVTKTDKIFCWIRFHLLVLSPAQLTFWWQKLEDGKFFLRQYSANKHQTVIYVKNERQWTYYEIKSYHNDLRRALGDFFVCSPSRKPLKWIVSRKNQPQTTWKQISQGRSQIT